MTTSADGVAVRECAYCGNEFQPPIHGGRAKYCTPAHRQAAYNERRRAERVHEVTEEPGPEQPAAEGLAAAVLSHLTLGDRLESVDGQAALALARRIDAYAPIESGAGLAALVRELRAALAATPATSAAGDPVAALRLVT